MHPPLKFDGDQPADEPAVHAARVVRVAGDGEEDQQSAEEDDAAQDDDLPQPVRQRFEPRQRDQHEQQHDHAVEQALDDHGRERGGHRHAGALFQHVGAQHLARTGRIDVVAHVADRHDRKQHAQRDGLDRAQHVVPAPGARQHCQKVRQDAGDDPEIIRVAERVPNFAEVLIFEGKPQKNRADHEAQYKPQTRHAQPLQNIRVALRQATRATIIASRQRRKKNARGHILSRFNI